MLRGLVFLGCLAVFTPLCPADSVPSDYSSQLEEIFAKTAEKEGEKGWKSLDEKERTVSLIRAFLAEIANGGVEQFYVNESGERTHATLAALQAIGDTRTAEEFKKTFVFFKGGVPPADGERKGDPFAESSPKMQPVFEWFNDYMAHVSEVPMHLYVYCRTGKAVSDGDLRKENPGLFKKDRILEEMEAAGPEKAFAAFLKLYEDSSFKAQESFGPDDPQAQDVGWRLKWSKAFDSKAVADLIEKHLKLRDESKDPSVKEEHDLFCTGLFSLMEFQTSPAPSLEDRLLAWEKRGLEYDDPAKEVIAETFGPAGVLHKYWPDRYPELTWADEGKGFKNAEVYRKAISDKKL